MLDRIKIMWLYLIILLSLRDWSEMSGEGFQILYQPGLEKFARMVQNQAPKAKKLMEKRLGQKFDQQIRIVISESEEFAQVQPHSPPEWASATAYPEQNLIFLKPLARAGTEDYSQTFLHELAHLFIHQRLKGQKVPKWFEEGLATVFSGESSFERFRILAQMGLSGKHLPFEDLEQGFPFNTRLAQIAYLQSEDLVSFLMSQLGSEQFPQFLDRIAQGEDFYQTLQELSGLSFLELEKRWQNRLKYRYGLAFALGGSSSLWFIITLLFLIAYVTKKRRARMKKEMMAYEEHSFGSWSEEEGEEEEEEESGSYLD